MLLFRNLYKRFYGYPSRGHIRDALHGGISSSGILWRVGMLYVCGQSIQEIANSVEIPKERVKMVLNSLVMGVK